MVESVKWWFSLRRNANFWDWMRDTYSLEELNRLSTRTRRKCSSKDRTAFNEAVW